MAEVLSCLGWLRHSTQYIQIHYSSQPFSVFRLQRAKVSNGNSRNSEQTRRTLWGRLAVSFLHLNFFFFSKFVMLMYLLNTLKASIIKTNQRRKLDQQRIAMHHHTHLSRNLTRLGVCRSVSGEAEVTCHNNGSVKKRTWVVGTVGTHRSCEKFDLFNFRWTDSTYRIRSGNEHQPNLRPLRCLYPIQYLAAVETSLRHRVSNGTVVCQDRRTFLHRIFTIVYYYITTQPSNHPETFELWCHFYRSFYVMVLYGFIMAQPCVLTTFTIHY